MKSTARKSFTSTQVHLPPPPPTPLHRVMPLPQLADQSVTVDDSTSSSNDNDEARQITSVDFEMDFRFESDDNDTFASQLLDSSNNGLLIDLSDNGGGSGDSGKESPQPVNGQLDYGMYTRTKENVECAYCHDKFDSKASLLIHKSCFFLRKGVEAINRGQQPFAGTRWTFECEEMTCDLVVQDLPALKLHMMTHYGGMFECKECTYKTPGEAHMRQHLITHTGNYKSY